MTETEIKVHYKIIWLTISLNDRIKRSVGKLIPVINWKINLHVILKWIQEMELKIDLMLICHETIQVIWDYFIDYSDLWLAVWRLQISFVWAHRRSTSSSFLPDGGTETVCWFVSIGGYYEKKSWDICTEMEYKFMC